MQDRGFGSGVSIVVSTASDLPGLSANAVDSFDQGRGIIVLRGFEAGPGIAIDLVNYDDNVYDTTQNRIRISATGSGGSGGGSTTASNVGNGIPVFSQQTGDNLLFNTLAAGSGVSITSTGGLITISSTGGGLQSVSNIGTGVGVYAQTSNNVAQFRNILAGPSGNVSVTLNGGDIVVDSTDTTISSDTNPTLGGNLNVNGFAITSSVNGNIHIIPNGTGKIFLGTLAFPSADGTSGQVLTTNGSGTLSWVSLGSMATQNANAVAITGGTLNGVSIGATTPSTASFTTLSASGLVTLNGNKLPSNAGQSGQFLSTDGAGNLSWATPSSGGSGSSNGANLGSGTGVYSANTGATLNFKSLVAGSNVTITSDANTITISSTGSGTSGATAFTGLSDVPSSYTGSANYAVTVNSSANGLAFTQLAAVATTGAASSLSGLATVATTGLYSSLVGSPTIPTKTSQLTNDAGFLTTLPAVGTAGTYGSATQVPVITTDANGRVTAVTLATITGTGGLTSLTLTGDATGTNSGNNLAVTLASVGTAGTYGNASHVPVFVTDAKGRVTSVTSTAIAIPSTAVTGLATSATTDTTNAANISSGVLAVTRLPTAGTAGTYGSATQYPVITTDIYGRVTAVTLQTVSGGSGGLTSLTLTGDATGTNSGNNLAVTLAAVGTAGTYGSATGVPVITTDGKGRVTNVTTVTPQMQVTDGTTTVTTSQIQFSGATVTNNSGVATVTVSGSGSATALTKYVVTWQYADTSNTPSGFVVPTGWSATYNSASTSIVITVPNTVTTTVQSAAFFGVTTAGGTRYSMRSPASSSKLETDTVAGNYTIYITTANTPTNFGCGANATANYNARVELVLG